MLCLWTVTIIDLIYITLKHVSCNILFVYLSFTSFYKQVMFQIEALGQSLVRLRKGCYSKILNCQRLNFNKTHQMKSENILFFTIC